MLGNDLALPYVKERYTDELQRLKDIEDKAIKLTSLLSILIAALGTGLGINKDPLINPESLIDWIIIALAVYLMIFLFCSWANAMRAIKIGRFPVVPHNREALEWIQDADTQDCEVYIVNCYVDVIELLSKEIERKVDALQYCYKDLTFSAWLASALVISFYISEL